VKKGIHITLLVAWIVIILVVTGYPNWKTTKLPTFPYDKIFHFVLFFILGALQYDVIRKHYFFVVGLGLVLIAELQQIFIPGRDFEILDIIAGIIGLLTVYFVFKWRKISKHEVSET
jgi:VanZ family protein